ncbi:hypothetical protein GN244_ATG09529 [Phytophthora infestans]|uniref:Uncharacterized protein n=1 Tax=Phytophthora infestans TaxID=4787 RepID=A0A833WDK2_PHYIN|nr:hypothetical protein GN244_ATG09529 [Phytophthora infestans]
MPYHAPLVNPTQERQEESGENLDEKGHLGFLAAKRQPYLFQSVARDPFFASSTRAPRAVGWVHPWLKAQLLRLSSTLYVLAIPTSNVFAAAAWLSILEFTSTSSSSS